MDCMHARLLLLFSRDGEPLLDPNDLGALTEHLASCPSCRSLAQSHRQTDAALARAMKQVEVPAGLVPRLHRRLAEARRIRPTTWYSLAAGLMLAVMGTVGWYVWPAPTLDFSELAEIKAGSSPAQVRAWFFAQGLEVEMPPEFNFNYLDHYEIVRLQGRSVAKLSFRCRTVGSSGDALAHVYIVPTHQFTVEDSPSLPVLVQSYSDLPGYRFLVRLSGGSLDWFLLRGV